MLAIDKYSRVPIYEQLINEFERMILSGELSEGGQMPSVRNLSQELSVNPNTLQKAYSELENKGICFSVPGSGRFIAKGAKEVLYNKGKKKLEEIKELCKELKQCGIDIQTVFEMVNEAYK